MKDNKLGIMPISKLIWNMSLPIIVSMLVQALYNIVDSVFVSQVSEQALTAVTLAFPAQNLMIGLATGTAVGIAISSLSDFAAIHAVVIAVCVVAALRVVSAIFFHRQLVRGSFLPAAHLCQYRQTVPEPFVGAAYLFGGKAGMARQGTPPAVGAGQLWRCYGRYPADGMVRNGVPL